MRGVFIHEWYRLFGGRSKWIHLVVHLIAAAGLVVASDVFGPEKTLVLEADVRAVTFTHGANDRLYLLSMMYALWLSGKLFLQQPSDIVMVHRVGRIRLMATRWTLGAALLAHHVLCAWLLAFILFNLAPYHAHGHLEGKVIIWGLLFALQGFTLFSLVASTVKSPLTLGVVLGMFFLVDIMRADAHRPETLDHIRYITFVLIPSMRPSSDGTLVIMTSLWLTLCIHGLFIIILSISVSSTEY